MVTLSAATTRGHRLRHWTFKMNRAEINEIFPLGQWGEVSVMPNAYGTHATAVHDGAVWLFGGVEDNARFVDVVLRAPFTSGGALGAWTRVLPGLPAARSHVHQAPVYRGRFIRRPGRIGASSPEMCRSEASWRAAQRDSTERERSPTLLLSESPERLSGSCGRS